MSLKYKDKLSLQLNMEEIKLDNLESIDIGSSIPEVSLDNLNS